MNDWFSFIAKKKKDTPPAIPSYKPGTNNTQAAAELDTNAGTEAMQVEEYTGSETAIQRIIKSLTGKE